jgi:Holliday junction DNA helicase RuvB
MIPPFSSANSQQRLISPMGRSEDQNDNNIRPALLAEYIGQPVVKEQMGVFINAALSITCNRSGIALSSEKVPKMHRGRC